MNDQERYDKALAFATQKHDQQFRIGGEPYITHPITVAKYVRDWGYGIDYQITALFHDLLEDTNATEKEIEQLGGKDVLEAVRRLTKKDGYIMSEYVGAIKKNDIAKIVKAADRLHNLRSATVASQDFRRRYILESVDWYLDLTPEIPIAVKELVQTLDEPLTDLPFLYEPIEDWKINS